MGSGSSVPENSSKDDLLGHTVNVPLNSLAPAVRVFQNFETSEVIVLLGDDISSCPGIPTEEVDEWFEMVVSSIQEQYLGSMNGTLNCRPFVGSRNIETSEKQLNVADSKSENQPVYSSPSKLVIKTSEYDNVKSHNDKVSDWTFDTTVESGQVSQHTPDSKDSPICPFCFSSIVNDDNHILVCSTSKAVRDRFEESDLVVQTVWCADLRKRCPHLVM